MLRLRLGGTRVSTSSCRIDGTSWLVWPVATSTCPTMTASQSMCKFPRSSSRRPCTSSCAQNLIPWPPTCFTTGPHCSTLVLELIALGILRAVACWCLKGQRERVMYGAISAQNRRYIPPSAICAVLVLIFSPDISSYSVSSYPHITVQLPTAARLRRCLAPRTPL